MRRDSGQQTRVFVSYSRRDSRFVSWLADCLKEQGFLVDYDLSTDDRLGVDTGISAEDAWWTRVEEMITAADVVVFVVSPDSARSRVCEEEIAFTQAIGKRLIPVLFRPVDYRKIPPRLAALNVKVSFAEAEAVAEHDAIAQHEAASQHEAAALQLLMDALRHDVRWYRMATQVTAAARRWHTASRPAGHLLRGSALQEAEEWAARRPAEAGRLPDVVLSFLRAGREQEEEVRLVAEIQRARLDELREIVEPYLLAEIRLREQHEASVHPFHREEFRQMTDYLRSLLRIEAKKWHPQRAAHVQATGARDGYADIYRFPCCGKYAREFGAQHPSQLSSEGCRDVPEAIRARPRQAPSDWRRGSLLLGAREEAEHPRNRLTGGE
ncbi:toll/interleukin-1 receptor domain-containing protein [Streptomyces sp. 1331.2]|uniref:toll/interleukin-1 receptor domain-containing protein n=1 Tax=Streptomyces sp. 1331.2 TaxID=1938835 RepID=UPI000BC4E40A|nr:toll/interleukin-1 receptor domain-containing protein [Streptomyces sp. 1331.2]SOB88470.1 TIR domain-containing protein [Streptomyces sp. 1331.2]